jgi:hypothetical protein
MKTPRFANTVIQLCGVLGISTTHYYALRKEPGAPIPASNGKFPIAAWRKFANRHRARPEKEKALSEREALEVELLRRRLYRTNLEIAEIDNTRSEEICNEITDKTRRILEVLSQKLFAMPLQLSGIFATMAPIEILKRWQLDLREVFQAAKSEILKIEREHARKSNIVSFDEKKREVA